MNDLTPDRPQADVQLPRATVQTRRYVLVAIGIAVILAVWGIWSRLQGRSALERNAENAAIPTVITVRPQPGPASDHLVLPGTVQGFYEAPIYARTNGYLRIWYTDIGTRVKKGQLLAEIETPEVDQELRQAEADLATARANYDLARITNQRWQGLLTTQSVSQQDADSRAGDAAAKQAAQQSASANVARLRELESFKRVLAPFDGVVTQRNTDIGALINAGQSPGQTLFRVADTHRLRIYVFVPQSFAASVRSGITATLQLADHPGRQFAATVTSTAEALDPTSRTLQVELQIDNTKGELFPGSYAQVSFKLAASENTLRVPTNAVMFRTANLQVAAVDDTQHVHLKNITAGRDFGTEIEVLAGLSPTDRLVVNPPDSIADGQQVRVQQTPPPQAPAAGVAGHAS
jgi:RND family efflux transporter MFP subunit